MTEQEIQLASPPAPMDEYLITTSTVSYADEFEVLVFVCMKAEHKRAFINALLLIQEDDINECEFYFGSNESVAFAKEELLEILYNLEPMNMFDYHYLKKNKLNIIGCSLDPFEYIMRNLSWIFEKAAERDPERIEMALDKIRPMQRDGLGGYFRTAELSHLKEKL